MRQHNIYWPLLRNGFVRLYKILPPHFAGSKRKASKARFWHKDSAISMYLQPRKTEQPIHVIHVFAQTVIRFLLQTCVFPSKQSWQWHLIEQGLTHSHRSILRRGTPRCTCWSWRNPPPASLTPTWNSPTGWAPAPAPHKHNSINLEKKKNIEWSNIAMSQWLKKYV